jgi:hypothetical protein
MISRHFRNITILFFSSNSVSARFLTSDTKEATRYHFKVAVLCRKGKVKRGSPDVSSNDEEILTSICEKFSRLSLDKEEPPTTLESAQTQTQIRTQIQAQTQTKTQTQMRAQVV